MRLAAVRVKSSTQNSMVQAQAEQSIKDASRHIDYLAKELEKLQIKQRNSLQYPASPQGSGFYPPQLQQPPYPREEPVSMPVVGCKTALSNLGGVSWRILFFFLRQ